MRAFVYPDQALARHAGRFVWLDIDTERAESAVFLEKFPVSSWPTLLVVDPTTETAALRWLGSATVMQLAKLLEDGERAVRGGGESLEAQLAQADKLYAGGEAAKAASLLQELLARAPEGWPRRARAVESLLFALSDDGQDEACARSALAELPRLERSPSWANAAMVGLSCALGASPEASWKKEAVAALEVRVREALAPPSIPMGEDDQSGLYEVLVQARQQAEDTAGKQQVAQEWAAMLEAAAARAPSAEARSVFDSHRLGAYLALGEPERAVSMLQASERDLPADYNPPARLAVAFAALERYDEALAANDRALARVYGPRKLRVLAGRADILLAQGHHAQARKTLEEALAHARTLPAVQVSPRVVASLKARLEKLLKEEGQ